MSVYTITITRYGLSCDECGQEYTDEDANTIHGATHTQLLVCAAEEDWAADPAISERATCPDCRHTGCARLPHHYTPWRPADPVHGVLVEQRHCRYCLDQQFRPVTIPLPLAERSPS